MVTQSVNEVYLDGLLKDELALTEEDAALKVARAKYELASNRYAASRDMVTEHFGHSPYASKIDWQAQINDSAVEIYVGFFRFIKMQVGDAIKEVLGESSGPLALIDIVKLLNAGSMHTSSRSVNAALMQLSGIQKTSDDKYAYNDIDDLPF